MKRSFLVTLLSLQIIFISAQTVTLQVGPSFSKLDYTIGDLLGKNTTGVNVMAGIDYLDMKYFNLSSNIGFIQKGGQDSIWVSDINLLEVTRELFKTHLNYLTLNTTANLKITINDLITPYIFGGPRIDYMISYNEDAATIEQFDDAGKLNRFQYGFIAGGGIKVNIKKFSVGACYNYYFNLGKLADYENYFGTQSELTDHTFSVTATVGYKL